MRTIVNFRHDAFCNLSAPRAESSEGIAPIQSPFRKSNMSKQNVFETVKSVILEVLPDLNPELVTIEKQLKELGANSIDRMEVVTMSMEALGLKLPMMTFAQVSNIEGLVDVLTEKVEARALSTAQS